MVRLNLIQLYLLSAIIATSTTVPVMASVMWDESIDGDLSGDYQSPTALIPIGVNNQVLYSSVSADREYIPFDVDAGDQLAAIIVDNWTSTDDKSFLAVASGNPFPTPPTSPGPNPAVMLGYHHFGVADVGLVILQIMGAGPGSQGFSGPLGAGTYTFWAQETGPNAAAATLNFVITPIPEPATGILLVGGLAMLTLGRRWAI